MGIVSVNNRSCFEHLTHNACQVKSHLGGFQSTLEVDRSDVRGEWNRKRQQPALKDQVRAGLLCQDDQDSLQLQQAECGAYGQEDLGVHPHQNQTAEEQDQPCADTTGQEQDQ